MVLRNSGVRRSEGITVISQVLGVVTSAAATFLLMPEIFIGGDGQRRIVLFAEASGGSAGGGSALIPSSFNVGIAIAVTAMAGLALAVTLVYSSRSGSLKSPWSRRRRKHALLAKQWKSLFDADGRLSDGGVKFLKKIRAGGVDPSIRMEVWPFLLGLYDVKSSKEERDTITAQKRREYVELRKQCRQISKRGEKSFKLKEASGNNSNEDGGDISQVFESSSVDEADSARPSVSMEGASLSGELHGCRETVEKEEDYSEIMNENISEAETDSSDSDSSEDLGDTKSLLTSTETEDSNRYEPVYSALGSFKTRPVSYKVEDFATWQRIIRLDAIRANAEWVIYSPSQASVSEAKARRLAESVGLKDYDHLEPCRVHHAARLVAVLEAYAVYDSEIGYCQGMSDLLSPIISVIEQDHVAFWCFVGFMRKARHNFRLDEVGIRRQLNIVSKIIRGKDSHLYKHLEKLEAEDCFFVYRMVVVLFRRELTFEQTLCLWEVIWADQAAIRAGIVKSAWRRMRLRAPPTEDLLLYAIAACVLQKRKLIIENYSSMDEIMKECNSMAGHLDVWRLLDDAHDLVVTLHDKI
ncbi:Ypt/Rab-GAP domain of gyp1p superfamily protein [Perilla frutescens var. hirtella]|uniref:Ypt/Rab-GAP domain of gyp1p superfamily protein n=1 Tax=Perilla frutescens var. hirtella TaxID=608512 RepID=A0AAD4JCS7_PERFH|nr:Ypt/Rab-GAP domain of gyp1p superfamily protein [Perilla frutescens var. frutescens]KAH6831448.1 Ypt/Rab-GAP domain of gyp1p superfamily protein [Perilla frutescens var. hirtella]